jgi:peptidoglycan/LPS O-acetylase OafA/YrhL
MKQTPSDVSTAKSIANSSKYRPDIDGMRALAVLAVVIFHAFPLRFTGGFIGVDVFFVISGFLISSILFTQIENGNFSVRDFYVRRINRIFPALVVVLLSLLVFGWFALLSFEYEHLGKHIASAAIFISNFTLWSESGYFDSSAESKPLLHMWSLGIEEQFYIFWPLLLWFGFRKKVNIFSLTIFILLASFIYNLEVVHSNAAAAFYSPMTRFWELMSGSAIAWMQLKKYQRVQNLAAMANKYLVMSLFSDRRSDPMNTTLLNVSAGLGSAILVYGFVHMDRQLPYPGSWALLAVVGTVLMILAGPEAWLNKRILSQKVVVAIGLISYPLYLWHWPLLSLARVIENGLPARNLRLGLLAISIFLAWGTYQFLETPIRKSKNKTGIAMVIFAIMMATGLSGFWVFHKGGFPQRPQIASMTAFNEQFDGNWAYATNEICSERYPLAGAEKYGWWFCIMNRNQAPTVLVLGNSFGNHLYPGLAFNNSLKHQTILSIGACGPEWVERDGMAHNQVTTAPCSGTRSVDQMELINGLITKERSIKYVIISGFEMDNYLAPSGLGPLIKRINFLEQGGARVIIFSPHVQPDYNITGCYSRPFKETQESCQISREKYLEIAKKFEKLANAIRTSNPRVLFFDPNFVFCDSSICKFRFGDMPAFRDEYGHFSLFASQKVGSSFVDWAQTHLPEILESRP